jgi:hypothetical protein
LEVQSPEEIDLVPLCIGSSHFDLLILHIHNIESPPKKNTKTALDKRNYKSIASTKTGSKITTEIIQPDDDCLKDTSKQQVELKDTDKLGHNEAHRRAGNQSTLTTAKRRIYNKTIEGVTAPKRRM